MRINYKSNRAAILIITLWVITLLSVIAMSVTYRVRMEIRMSSGELDRQRVFFIAKAGVPQALSILDQDTNEYDSLNEQWANYAAEPNLFRNISVGRGKFSISYVSGEDIFGGTSQIFYGMQDEERKININKASQDMLESIQGVDLNIAKSIRAWRGDPDVSQDILSKEDAYYQGLEKPYRRKGKPIEHLEELALVHGITPELLYGKDINGDGYIDASEGGVIKYLTVFGEDGLININTAGITILRAVGFTEDLSYRIIRYRTGYDEIQGTEDDGIFTDVNKVAEILSYFEPMLPGEEELIKQKQSFLKVKSRYYKANIDAEIPGKVKYKIVAVLDKESAEGDQIVAWSE